MARAKKVLFIKSEETRNKPAKSRTDGFQDLDRAREREQENDWLIAQHEVLSGCSLCVKVPLRESLICRFNLFCLIVILFGVACVLVSAGMCVLRSEHTEVRDQVWGVGSLLPLWDPGMKLRSSASWGRCFL